MSLSSSSSSSSLSPSMFLRAYVCTWSMRAFISFFVGFSWRFFRWWNCGYDCLRHAIRSEAFDVVTKVERFASRNRSRFYLMIRFLNELPPLGGISRSPSCEASAIRSRARYVTIPARVYDYSTGNEVRRYTRGYPREKSIHDPPGPGFRRARIYISRIRGITLWEKRHRSVFRKILSVCTCIHRE